MANLLTHWFGISSIDKSIHNELSCIETLLNDLSDIENILNNKWDRAKKLRRVLKKTEKKIKKGYAIEQKLEKTLEPYINGNKKSKHLISIIALNTLLREFKNDSLWQELLSLWHQEYNLLQNNDIFKLKINLYEQKRIAEILKTIVEQELGETHMHLIMSVDAHIHWHYLKKLWGKALPGKTTGAKSIISLFENNAKEGKISINDLQSLKKIMQNYFNNKWPETKAFVKFEELLFMFADDQGQMQGFEKKSRLLCIILENILDTKIFMEEYFYKCMDSVVKHNLAHNITHIEIRNPCYKIGGLRLFASLAKEMEEKYEKRIKIRLIESISYPGPKPVFDAYNRLPKYLKKYFVAVDLLGRIEDGQAMRKMKESPLPICIHAGEFFSQKDFPQRTKAENVKYALIQIQSCLRLPRLHRIGHANILGLNIKKYLLRTDSMEVEKLINLQKRLIREIKKRDIFIEANPTSNVMIRGITYKDHPISTFLKQDLKFAISTDDRIIFDSNLKKEYYRIIRAMKWTWKEIEKAAEMQKEAMLK